MVIYLKANGTVQSHWSYDAQSARHRLRGSSYDTYSYAKQSLKFIEIYDFANFIICMKIILSYCRVINLFFNQEILITFW